MSKKQRKRHEKKMALIAASQPRKVPLHEQSVDLTPAPYNVTDMESKDVVTQAIDSLKKRSMITKSAREARRKAIKEANFLRGL
jgi:large subunit ribosomal protein L54